MTVTETVVIKHSKLTYNIYSTDTEQPNSHLLSVFPLSCSEMEIWKAKIEPSQNPLQLEILLAISAQWDVGERCGKGLPGRVFRSVRLKQPGFQLQLFSLLSNWSDAWRCGSQVVITRTNVTVKMTEQGGGAGSSMALGSFVLAACASGLTIQVTSTRVSLHSLGLFRAQIQMLSKSY